MGKWFSRLHIYFGFYFLFFTWLFSLSGLLLNHPKWGAARFWPGREQTAHERPVQPVGNLSRMEKARGLMRQLGISGEIEWPGSQPADSFVFQVIRPGRIVEIRTGGEEKTASVQEIRTNAWGIVSMLHTFTGVRAGDPAKTRDWLPTIVWSLSIDALAAGLAVLALTGVYLGFRRKERLPAKILAFSLGLAACAFFVFGWRLF